MQGASSGPEPDERKAPILHLGGQIRETLLDTEGREIVKLTVAQAACPNNA